MINSVVSFIINLFLKVISFILNIILSPLTLLLGQLFPGISDFFSLFNNLLQTYLFPGLRFAREVIFNLTGVNRDLVGILAVIPLTYFTFMMANLAIRFLISVWRIWKKGESN